jgi:hypothetical protein
MKNTIAPTSAASRIALSSSSSESRPRSAAASSAPSAPSSRLGERREPACDEGDEAGHQRRGESRPRCAECDLLFASAARRAAQHGVGEIKQEQ